MRAKFTVFQKYTDKFLNLNTKHVQSLYQNTWDERLQDIKYYLNRLEKLMILDSDDSQYVDEIDYSYFDMLSIVDVAASWESCLGDLTSMLDNKYVEENAIWQKNQDNFANMFSDWEDPRC